MLLFEWEHPGIQLYIMQTLGFMMRVTLMHLPENCQTKYKEGVSNYLLYEKASILKHKCAGIF